MPITFPIDINDADFISGDAPAVPATRYIDVVVSETDGTNDPIPLVLTESEQIRVIKLSGVTETILAVGEVPNNKIWIVTGVLQIAEQAE